MATNRDLQAARDYHSATKHSWSSVRASGQSLDFANQPSPLKIYPRLEPIPLPRELGATGVRCLSALASTERHVDSETVPDLRTLAHLLYFTNGITKRREVFGGHMSFRAAACTGALYHHELYLICGDLPDFSAGVYHFGVHDLSLRRLRTGDFRQILVAASGGERSVSNAPAVLVVTDTFWRNAWKYQARMYRHAFWDSGVMLANTLALAQAQQLPASLVTGFVDREVNRLLDLDTDREVSLVIVPLGYTENQLPGPAPRAKALGLETTRLSPSEVDYPAIRAVHAASSLDSAEEVISWRGKVPNLPLPEPWGQVTSLQPFQQHQLPLETIEEIIVRRGSSRRFTGEAISLQALSTILQHSTGSCSADYRSDGNAGLNDVYLIINEVDGLSPGTYVYHPQRQALEQLKRGDLREQAGYLGLEQELAAQAAVSVYFLADLEPILERYGNRGYRVAQLDAAISAGRMYLAAYAFRLGATGLTFYDDAVISLFSPHAEGKSVMFLLALGVPNRRQTGQGQPGHGSGPGLSRIVYYESQRGWTVDIAKRPN